MGPAFLFCFRPLYPDGCLPSVSHQTRITNQSFAVALLACYLEVFVRWSSQTSLLIFLLQVLAVPPSIIVMLRDLLPKACREHAYANLSRACYPA